MASQEFEQQLVATLPGMRAWAFAMTRDRAAADDLVQDTLTKALAAWDSFAIGTNHKAWLRRIMANHFITGIRSRRVTSDEMPDFPVAPTHLDRIALRELALAVELLPSEQKTALFAIALAEKSYEEFSKESGCPIGTLKSRVHRARLHLRSHMDGERRLAA